MKRRAFIALAAVAVMAPLTTQAGQHNYRPGLVDELLADGQTVFVEFKTNWCPTCAAQQRVIGGVTSEDSAYLENVEFVTVDWDIYSSEDLARRLNIPRRSTLVVLQGDQELGRIVAGTSRSAIKGLMDTALTAAQSNGS
ncbi:thioredoxin family protein [Cochlodiniinecator piscidefendens]|uniref:thioredoxin family protein n=1 Tax=Cochlodiniinecator piscidefendens TaxID=2715756 RepID=UPI00140DAC19|nr:thioredoxin family protein [Cochlodiniinecator piscidefendens]